MESNPYRSPSSSASRGLRGTRPVRSLVCAGFGFAVTAVAVAMPGAYLFNQEVELIPMESGVHDIHVGDIPISNGAVIIISWLLCFCLWSIAAGLLAIAFRNHHLNHGTGSASKLFRGSKGSLSNEELK